MRSNPGIGVVVATRRVRLGAKKKPVIVKIGKPRKAGREEWRCPYSIKGLGTGSIQYASGADAVQALLMCIEAVRTRLESCGREITWESGEPGDTGFPRLVPTLYGQRFYKRLERLIDREIQQFARKAEESYRRRIRDEGQGQVGKRLQDR